MSLIEHIHDDVVVLEPRERLTVETEQHLWEAVRRHLNENHLRLVLDLEHVPYIDSCGLGAIVSAHVSAWRRGGGLKLINVRGRNHRLLSITRLLTVLDVYESEDAARMSFATRAAELPFGLGTRGKA